jgi:hypothetical protein
MRTVVAVVSTKNAITLNRMLCIPPNSERRCPSEHARPLPRSTGLRSASGHESGGKAPRGRMGVDVTFLCRVRPLPATSAAKALVPELPAIRFVVLTDEIADMGAAGAAKDAQLDLEAKLARGRLDNAASCVFQGPLYVVGQRAADRRRDAGSTPSRDASMWRSGVVRALTFVGRDAPVPSFCPDANGARDDGVSRSPAAIVCIGRTATAATAVERDCADYGAAAGEERLTARIHAADYIGENRPVAMADDVGIGIGRNRD